MNIKEIYILNRALDGQDIPFLPAYKSLDISELTIDSIKEGMVRKGLLASHSEFSNFGILIASRLLKYKKAKKHIKLNNLYIGMLNDTESILIQWNPPLQEYSIDLIINISAVNQIAERYEFLTENLDEPDEQPKELSFDELNTRYNLSSHSFRLSTLSGRDRTDEIYFKSDNKLYIYDFMTHVLQPINRQNIIIMLSERIYIS